MSKPPRIDIRNTTAFTQLLDWSRYWGDASEWRRNNWLKTGWLLLGSTPFGAGVCAFPAYSELLLNEGIATESQFRRAGNKGSGQCTVFNSTHMHLMQWLIMNADGSGCVAASERFIAVGLGLLTEDSAARETRNRARTVARRMSKLRISGHVETVGRIHNGRGYFPDDDAGKNGTPIYKLNPIPFTDDIEAHKQILNILPDSCAGKMDKNAPRMPTDG